MTWLWWIVRDSTFLGHLMSETLRRLTVAPEFHLVIDTAEKGEIYNLAIRYLNYSYDKTRPNVHLISIVLFHSGADMYETWPFQTVKLINIVFLVADLMGSMSGVSCFRWFLNIELTFLVPGDNVWIHDVEVTNRDECVTVKVIVAELCEIISKS